MLQNTTLDQSNPLISLENKIKSKNAIIGVIGLGYVGLPFAVEKGKVGLQVKLVKCFILPQLALNWVESEKKKMFGGHLHRMIFL